ncbi:MAG: hypothetical protein ACKOE7_10630, partial [Actinomycetota bacterium]
MRSPDAMRGTPVCEALASDAASGGAQPTLTPIPTTTNRSRGDATASNPPNLRPPTIKSFGHF